MGVFERPELSSDASHDELNRVPTLGRQEAAVRPLQPVPAARIHTADTEPGIGWAWLGSVPSQWESRLQGPGTRGQGGRLPAPGRSSSANRSPPRLKTQ